MEKINLDDNKIYKGYYIKENQNFFCFFKKVDNICGVDAITNKNFNINKFDIVEYDYDVSEYKKCLKCYKNNQDESIFLVKPIEESIKNSFYSKTLRYFELDDSKLIFKKDIDKTILYQVIQKVQKFTKHFLGIQESIIYAKQLNHLECIFDVLTFFPKELTDKTTPFWLTELKSNENYFPVITYPIGDMQEYNKFNLNIYLNHKDRALNNKIIEDYIESIRRKEESVYEKMCSDKMLTRLNEARITLDNELHIAKENNDEDLIFEISIISEELQKIEENIPNINFYDDAINWWPDLLYPVPFVEKFERNEDDVYMLERIRDHYPTLL